MKFLQNIEKKNIKLSINLMDTKNRNEINKFLSSYYKSFGLRYSLDFKWFNWYYNDNPCGKCQNYILTNENNDIIGAFGYSIFNYTFKEVGKLGVIGVNGFINPEYTGLGLYTELISETLKDIHRNYELAFSFPHCNNIGSVKGHINSGWVFSKSFHFYVKNLNTLNNVIIDNNALESDFKELINYRFSKTLSMVFIKNFEWLNWRFYERPDKDYHLVIYKNNRNIVRGYIIYTYYKDINNLIRCQIADYDYNDINVYQTLLNKVMQVAYKHDCSTVELLVNDDHSDTEILVKESFVRKDECYKMFLNGELSKFTNSKDFKFEFGYFDVI